MKPVQKLLFAVTILSGVVGATTPPGQSSNKLAGTNPAVLCYAQTGASKDERPLITSEIVRRMIDCTPELVDTGKRKFEQGVRATESKKLTRDAQRAVPPAPIVTCKNSNGATVSCQTAGSQ